MSAIILGLVFVGALLGIIGNSIRMGEFILDFGDFLTSLLRAHPKGINHDVGEGTCEWVFAVGVTRES